MSKARFLVLSVLVANAAAVSLFALGAAGKSRAESLTCASSVCALSFAARVWAEDNGGRCAADFSCMSNEISATKILICPADHGRQNAKDWANLSAANCSYEILSPGLRVEETNTAVLRCRFHGHLGYTDGTVFDGHRRRHKYE